MAEYDIDDRRITTEHTQGVWTTCDECGDDWWCVVGERDYLDEPVSWICSDGCDDEDDDWQYEGVRWLPVERMAHSATTPPTPPPAAAAVRAESETEGDAHGE